MYTRWRGLIGVAVGQTFSRATATARQRLGLTVLGVAVVIALLVVVTAIGVGLATSTSVYDDDVDYWIVPDTEGGSSPLVATDGPSFGDAHATTTRIEGIDGVDYVSPIAMTVLQIEHDGHSEYVLVVGVISQPGLDELVGVDSTALTPGDPYYTEGTWIGEVVLSEHAASLLAVDEGEPVAIGGTDTFTVTAIDDAQSAEAATIPVALVQLSEHQALTGADEDDLADQFVVGTNDPALKAELAGIYPQSTVHSRATMATSETMDAALPLALAGTAFIIAVAIGTLFVVTTLGLELVAERRQLATLSALGLSIASHLRLIGVQTLLTTLAGGLLGGVGGVLITIGINELAMEFLTSGPVAFVHPLFVGYGLAVSLVIGLVSLPWLALTTNRLARGVP
ncbi:FtsX-like permease family protein [Natronosalvus rutilus]|uniref:ABC transporter permease n=1 Tax=Natronosalvus rutilus TaxID=2953753 RepID=A0A9E7NDE2_9EURY|nr:FtsX-like permease family protein [Natronosalvus rutilus]UTF54843.1 ABC transporter permease [Natronosalvus rutilus]